VISARVQPRLERSAVIECGRLLRFRRLRSSGIVGGVSAIIEGCESIITSLIVSEESGGAIEPSSLLRLTLTKDIHVDGG
jgi:hypothetical protein